MANELSEAEKLLLDVCYGRDGAEDYDSLDAFGYDGVKAWWEDNKHRHPDVTEDAILENERLEKEDAAKQKRAEAIQGLTPEQRDALGLS